ncbi:hypothetical protein LCM02_05875 [Lutimonas saemankumensis]|uniref:hypothetical protein n=1 Tax=Lutimonas saemankumensis TaxID=483016 RepID=UPI001CD63757|nr:hypothetical protein [Lutimonas saemankumensis]MCA0931970.1 hypothetical protein [Lutimonas saemankumensis]
MKKIFFSCAACVFMLLFSSCTTNDVKEISGTIIIKDLGSHVFNINADNIHAKIIMPGPEIEHPIVYDQVPLFRTSDYNARIEIDESGKLRSELLNNLVVMYEVETDEIANQDLNQLLEEGFIKIEWTGIN